MKYYTFDELSQFKTYAFLGEDSIYRLHYGLTKECIINDYYPNLTYDAQNPEILITVYNETNISPPEQMPVVDYINLFIEKGGIEEIEFDNESIENLKALSQSNDYSQKKLLNNMLFNLNCLKYKNNLVSIINDFYKIRGNFIKTDDVANAEIAGYLYKHKILYVAYNA